MAGRRRPSEIVDRARPRRPALWSLRSADRARRRILTLVLLPTLVVGCAGDQPDETSRSSSSGPRTEALSGSVEDEDTLMVLYPHSSAAPTLLGPAMDDSPKLLTFLPMLDWKWRCWGREAWTKSHGWPPPGLAKSWEHSPDGRVWTVWLREDLRWHDGIPVTAEDIGFTIDLWKHPDVRHYAAEPVDSAVVLDPHTVRFFLKRPSDWPIGGWYVFYPKHLLEELPPKDFFEWEFWDLPVGDGPFRPVRHVPHTLIEFEADPDYPGGRPAVDRLFLKLADTDPVTELLSGNVDVAEMSPLEATKLAGDPRFRVHYHLGYGNAEVFWNLRLPQFEDVRVRRALAHAVDRPALFEVLDLPPDLPITDGVYSSCDFIRGELPEPLAYDTGLAMQLLEEAGWRDVDNDGVRERQGREFRFTLTVEGDRHRDVAVFLQDQLRRIGVRVEIQTLQFSVVRDRFRDGEFDAIIRRGAGVRDLAEGAPTGYDDPRVNELVRASRQAVDMEESIRIYRELGEITRRDMPFLNLHPRIRAFVARRRVRGLDRLYSTGNMIGIEHLWIEETDQAGRTGTSAVRPHEPGAEARGGRMEAGGSPGGGPARPLADRSSQ